MCRFVSILQTHGRVRLYSHAIYKIEFVVNDLLRITDGPFKGYEGKVSEIDEEKGKIKVLVSIFGRETPVELDFLQAKKI